MIVSLISSHPKDGLALQLDRKAKRLQPGATPHCSTWVLKFTKSPEVCAGWKNLQNRHYRGGGEGVTSAQNSKNPHHCGAQNHQGKILPEREPTTHMGFLPTTCQAYRKMGEIWKSFTPTNSECRLPWQRAETLSGPNQRPTCYPLSAKQLTKAENQEATIPKYNHKQTRRNISTTAPVRSFDISQATTLKPDRAGNCTSNSNRPKHVMGRKGTCNLTE